MRSLNRNKWLLALITLLFVNQAFATLIGRETSDIYTDYTYNNEVILDVVGEGDDRELVGAYNIKVDGTLWDVRFLDVTLANLFGDASGLDAVGESEGQKFSDRLNHQVLYIGIFGYGYFAQNPIAIRGCGFYRQDINQCSLMTPYDYDETTQEFMLAGVIAQQRDGSPYGRATVTKSPLHKDSQYFINSNLITLVDWATAESGEFRQSSVPPQLPEPSVLLLLLFVIPTLIKRSSFQSNI